MNANPFTKFTILSTVCALAFVCYPSVCPNYPEPKEPDAPIAQSFPQPVIAPEELIASPQEIVDPQSSPAEPEAAAPAHQVPAAPDTVEPNLPESHPRIHPNA